MILFDYPIGGLIMSNFKSDKDIFKEIWNNTEIDEEKIKNQLLLEIYDEFRKTDDKMDCDLIKENVETLYWIAGEEYENDIDVKTKVGKAINDAKTYGGKLSQLFRYKFLKPLLSVFMVILILIAGNYILVSATGDNILDEVIKFGDKYIGFNFAKGNKSSSEVVVSNDQIYKLLKEKCEHDHLFPLLPNLLPQDFKVTSYESQEFKIREAITIVLKDNKDSIILGIYYYPDSKDIPEIKTPATSVNRVVVDGKDVYISKNGDKYLAIFNVGNYIYNINSTLSYDQMATIIKSFK
jgi:hypothetical protein